MQKASIVFRMQHLTAVFTVHRPSNTSVEFFALAQCGYIVPVIGLTILVLNQAERY